MRIPQPFCKYRDIFGAPGTGIHSYRLGNIAIVDFIMTLVLIIAIVVYFGTSPAWTTLIVFALAELLHYMFCIRSPLVF